MTTLKGLPPPAMRPRTPVHGDAVAHAKTQGTPQTDEHVAVHKLQTQLDPRDLDLFLKARAGEKQKGVLQSLKRALQGTAPGKEAGVDDVRATLASAMHTLTNIYADGLVTEGEISALGGARSQMKSVLSLNSPEVMNLLPRSTKERLQETLFDPLMVMYRAANRRFDRLMGVVEVRDGPALRERLKNPEPTYALFNPADTARAGTPMVTASRFKAGDLVAVPRSDGRSSLGVVVEHLGNQLRVEFLDESSGSFALKTLDQRQILASNPLKIGDYLEVDDKQIWVKGVGADGRLEARMKTAGDPKLSTLGGDAFAHVVSQAAAQHHYATLLESLPGMNELPPVTRRLARFAVDMGPSDKVFGRLSMELLKALQEPDKRLGSTPFEQAIALTKLLREEPKHLHSVIPNFRTDRPVALVSSSASVQGAGAHPLMRPLPGAQVPGHAVQSVTFFHETPAGGVSHTLQIVMPSPPPPAPPGKRHADMTEVVFNLAKLPYDSLKEIRNVVVNPTASPDDAYWQKEFNNPNHTAFMSADKRARTLSIFPSHNFVEMELSLAHEVGHFVGSDKLGPPSDARWQQWGNAATTDNLSVSRYAKNNLDEDFAETYSLYTMSKDTPAHAKYRGLMPERFAMLDRLSA